MWSTIRKQNLLLSLDRFSPQRALHNNNKTQKKQKFLKSYRSKSYLEKTEHHSNQNNTRAKTYNNNNSNK